MHNEKQYTLQWWSAVYHCKMGRSYIQVNTYLYNQSFCCGFNTKAICFWSHNRNFALDLVARIVVQKLDNTLYNTHREQVDWRCRLKIGCWGSDITSIHLNNNFYCLLTIVKSRVVQISVLCQAFVSLLAVLLILCVGGEGGRRKECKSALHGILEYIFPHRVVRAEGVK